MKEKKYISDNEDLMKEWDYEKNIGLDPQKMTLHSNIKAWWKCSKNHSYHKTIDNRTNGSGCPYCSGRRLLSGFNDLQTLFPAIAKEWDYEKNGELKPADVLSGSTIKVHWICSDCKNEWITTVRSRTKGKTGCPKCSTKRRVKSFRANAINKNGKITNPLLILEWDYETNYPLRPDDFPPASNQSVSWKCSKCGHKWKAKISNRHNLKRGCPCCANRVIVQGKNDLATTHPYLAKEWHPTKNGTLTPQKISYGSNKKVWWICPKGHEYPATVLHRTSGTNCPTCNKGRQTSFAEQALLFYIKQIFPDTINRYKDIFTNGMELDIYIPSIKTAIEYDGVFYHKKEKIYREQIKYEICRKNHIKLIRIKEKDIFSNEPIADEIISVPGLGDSPKSLEIAIRIIIDDLDTRSNPLTRKHIYDTHSPIIINLKKDKYKIREYMPDLKKKSLADLRPDLAKEWHPTKNGKLTPDKFSVGSDIEVWWLCSICGHKWEASISHRTISKTGCPKCGLEKSTKAKRKAVEMIDPNTNEVIEEFISISDAARKKNIGASNITIVCKGIRPKAGGYKWRYKKQ